MTIDLVSKKDSKIYERGRPLDFGRHNSTRSTQAEVDMVFSASLLNPPRTQFFGSNCLSSISARRKNGFGSIPSFRGV